MNRQATKKTKDLKNTFHAQGLRRDKYMLS